MNYFLAHREPWQDPAGFCYFFFHFPEVRPPKAVWTILPAGLRWLRLAPPDNPGSTPRWRPVCPRSVVVRATHRSTGRLSAPRRWLAAVGLSAAIVLVPSPASAEAPKEEAVSTFFFGLSAGVLTLVYTPLKLVYATAAIPVSGLAWLWSVGDSEPNRTARSSRPLAARHRR